jgi:hypothetical protein
MLDVFQNTTLVKVIFHFMVGLPRPEADGGESTKNAKK